MAKRQFLVNIDLSKNQLLNAVVQNLATAPSNPLDGQIYWSTLDSTLYAYDDTNSQWIDLGSDGITNLAYTAGVSNGVVTSDTGNDATIPLADGTNAGLFSAAQKTKLDGIEAGAQADQNASEVASSASGNLTSTNVQSALEELQGDIDSLGSETNNLGITHNASDIDVSIENGSDITIEAATTSAAGVMTSDMFDEHVVNNAKVSNVVGDLSFSYPVGGTQITINTTNGNNVNIPSATTSQPGLLNPTKFAEIVANTAKVSNVDHPLVETAVPVGAVFTDTETTTSLALASNILTYTDEDGTDTDLDLSLYLDDTNLARLTSGSIDSSTGVATFTRDDSSTFTIDMSAFLDGITVNNTLTSTSTTEGLSAAQGKVLKDLVDTKGEVDKVTVDCAASTSTVVTHAQGAYPVVKVFRAASPYGEIEAQVTPTSSTTVVVTFNVAPSAGEYKIVVMG